MFNQTNENDFGLLNQQNQQSTVSCFGHQVGLPPTTDPTPIGTVTAPGNQSNSSIFGENSDQQLTIGMFGQQQTQPPIAGQSSLPFGTIATTGNQSNSTLFGVNSVQQSTVGLFGQPSQSNSNPAQQSTVGLFGQPTGRPMIPFGTGTTGSQSNSTFVGVNPVQQSTVGLFGQPVRQPTTAISTLPFGTLTTNTITTTRNHSNSKIFGENPPSIFNNNNNQAFPTNDPFGSKNETRHNRSTLFGEPNKISIFGYPNFGPTTQIAPTAFPNTNRGNGIFGTYNNNQKQHAINLSGSVNAKYQPTYEIEQFPATAPCQKLMQNSICFMKEYENKNFEEIRFEDYRDNNNFNPFQPNYHPIYCGYGYSTELKPKFGEQVNSFVNPTPPKFNFGIPPVNQSVYQLPSSFKIPYYHPIPNNPPFVRWPNQQPSLNNPFDKEKHKMPTSHHLPCGGYVFPHDDPLKWPTFANSKFPVDKETTTMVPQPPPTGNHQLCNGHMFPYGEYLQPNGSFNNNLAILPQPKLASVINPANGKPYTYGLPIEPDQSISENKETTVETKKNDNQDSQLSGEKKNNTSGEKSPPSSKESTTPPQPSPAIFMYITINNLTINMNTK